MFFAAAAAMAGVGGGSTISVTVFLFVFRFAQCRAAAAGGPAGLRRWAGLNSCGAAAPILGQEAQASDRRGGFVALIGGTGISACGRPPVALHAPRRPMPGTCRATNTLKPHFPAALPARVLALSGGLPIKGRPRLGRRARTTTCSRLASTRWPPSSSEPIRLNRRRPLLALAEADGSAAVIQAWPAERPAWPDLTRLPSWFVNSGRRRRRGSPEAELLATALQQLERMPGGRRRMADLLGGGGGFLHRWRAQR